MSNFAVSEKIKIRVTVAWISLQCLRVLVIFEISLSRDGVGTVITAKYLGCVNQIYAARMDNVEAKCRIYPLIQIIIQVTYISIACSPNYCRAVIVICAYPPHRIVRAVLVVIRCQNLTQFIGGFCA